MAGNFLNFFECQLNKNEVEVCQFDYPNIQMRQIRNPNPSLHFYRSGDKVYYWKKAKESELPSLYNATPITINTKDHPYIFANIIEMGVVEWIKGSDDENLVVRRNSYSNTWEIVNYSKDVLHDEVQGFQAYIRVHVSTFYAQTEPDEPRFGLCISANLKYRFTWDKQTWEKHGISTEGLQSFNGRISANKQAVKRFLQAQGVEKSVNQTLRQKTLNSHIYTTITQIYQRLDSDKSHIFLTDELVISTLQKKNLPYSSDQFSEEKITAPVQLYGYGQPASSGSLEQKIRRYKPASYEFFIAKRIVKIGVLSPKQYQGHVEIFARKIKTKLETVFHIPEVELQFQFIDDTRPETYEEYIHELNTRVLDLVLVILENENRKFLFRSPYYICKAKYIGQGVPTQDVMIKNVRSNNMFTLGNIALNIYAKLGGTPWTIKQRDESVNELIVGIGSTVNRDKKTVLGIAQIFQSSGKYVVGDCVPLSKYSDYTQKLELYLKRSLDDLIEDFLPEQKTIRIIFHLNKSPSNRYEIQAIQSVVEHFSDYEIEYALVKIGFGHNFRLFNDGGNQFLEEGLFIKLDDWAGLLTCGKKSPAPLLLRVDRRSKFTDLYYLAEQVYWFSFLSFKSYLGSNKSVTVLYPSLMTKLIEDMKQIHGWDEMKLGRIGDKLWFL